MATTATLGRLSACITFGWVIGPSLGSALYNTLGLGYVPLVSCSIFCVNCILGVLFVADADEDEIEKEEKEEEEQGEEGEEGGNGSSEVKGVNGVNGFVEVSGKPQHSREKEGNENTNDCGACCPSLSAPGESVQKNTSKVLQPSSIFSLPPSSIFRPFASLLLFRFVTSSTHALSIPNFHLLRYNIKPSNLGYYSSYGSILSLTTNIYALSPSIRLCKGFLAMFGAEDHTLNVVITATVSTRNCPRQW